MAALCLIFVRALRAWVALFAVCFFFFLFVLLFVCPRCLWRSVFSGPGCLWHWRLVPPPLFFSFSLPPPALFFFASPLCLVRRLLFVFFSAALFVVFFFVCRLCGAGSVCVVVVVGCCNVWCCWCCGLWCVVCFAWCCVACLWLAGCSRLAVRRGVALGLVGLFLLCSAVACCCVLCSFFFFCVVPCLSVVVHAVLVCVVLSRGASCCLAWPCCVAFLCWLLSRCANWCSAVP